MRTLRTALFTALSAALVLGLAACRDPAPTTPVATDDPAPMPPAEPAEPVAPAVDPAGGTFAAAEATAWLVTNQTPMVGGTLVFQVADGGVRMTGQLTGLAPGATHALHVHETGLCEPPAFDSAGAHLNPDDAPHGERVAGVAHHAGDMPNVTAGADGSVAVDQFLDGLTLADGGPRDVVGKAVVVHADPDDYRSQPAGNAGERIACGEITLTTAPPPAGLGPADESADPTAEDPIAEDPVDADSDR